MIFTMTVQELVMASTILTWIVLFTIYNVRKLRKIHQQLDEIQKIIDEIQSGKKNAESNQTGNAESL